jgi:hypothetical protein
VYPIEKIDHAELDGRFYKIWIKWKNWPDLTWRYRHDLVKETTNAEILKEMEDAVEEVRRRNRETYQRQTEDDEEANPPLSTQEQDDEPTLDTAMTSLCDTEYLASLCHGLLMCCDATHFD